MKEKRWQHLIDLDQLEPHDATPVKLGRQLLAVYDTTEGYRVSDARCTHAGANLCDGYFDGRHIECPLHQGLFDARTGRAIAAPVTRDLRMIECRVVDHHLEVLV
jgi:nitrite reductase/ring-hydroxylating ferredoxin subunit